MKIHIALDLQNYQSCPNRFLIRKTWEKNIKKQHVYNLEHPNCHFAASAIMVDFPFYELHDLASG